MISRERMDLVCERVIFWLVLAILVFAPLATGAVRPFDFLIIQTLTIVIAGVWALRVWVAPKTLLLWSPVCWAVVAFVVYAVVRYLNADVEYIARQELIRVIVYAVVFFAILNNLNRQNYAQGIAFTLIFLAMIISAYAIYQFATNSPMVWHFTKPVGYMHRAGGTFINPNHLAGFLEMVLPLGLAFALLGRLPHTSKVMLAYASAVMLAGIGVSVSRGGWVASALMLVIFFLSLIQDKRLRITALALAAVLAIGGFAFLNNATWAKRRMEQTFTDTGGLGVRHYFWQAAHQMWKDNLWTGVGPGHYDLRFRQYRPADWRAQTRPVYVHNDYLNTLADWGLIGFGIISGAMALLAIGAFKTWRFVKRSAIDLESKRSNRAGFLFGGSMGLLALLLHSTVEFNMQIPANALIAVAWMAFLTGWRRFATNQFWVTARIPLKAVMTIVILGGGFFLTVQATKKFNENVWLERAAEKGLQPNQKLVALKNAFAIEPLNPATASAIGETLRQESWKGDRNYAELAEEAMTWFDTGMSLNRWDPYNPLRYGMCLDWLGRTGEAQPYFERALRLDPNGYFVIAHQGWHYMQLEDYATARKWFERSLEVLDNFKNRNPMPLAYLDIIQRRLAEQAANPEARP